MKKKIAFLLGVIMLLGVPVTVKAAEPTANSYFYNNEGQAVVCPQPYIVSQTCCLGTSAPVAMSVYENEIYILDADGQVIVLDSEYRENRRISVKKDDAPYSLQEAKGVWIYANEMYIADRGGGVVVRSDLFGNITHVYADTRTGQNGGTFLPTGVVTDRQGNIYIMLENEYRGLVVIDGDGNFRGYFGANTVEVTAEVILDNLWRKYFLTEKQIETSIRNLPPPFLSIMANDGFIFASNTGSTGKLRKLNYNGNNILSPSGTMGTYDSESDSRFISLTADARGFITALDSEKKQIFQYDSEGNLLYTFGGLGSTAGSFIEPVAVCSMGEHLLVLDSATNILTLFVPSQFGADVREFRYLDIEGKYEQATEAAKRTLAICNEYEAAYYSLGQYAYSQGQYKESMEYFKACNSQEGYSKAFEGNRIALLKQIFSYILLGLLVIIVLIKVIAKFRKRNDESILFTRNRDFITRAKYAWYTVFHPIIGYSELRYNRLYSLSLANILYVLAFLTATFKFVSTGYTFSTTDATDYNLYICLAQTIGVLLLFVVSSRLVATFLEGVGTMKELWIAVGYAQIPSIIGNILYTVLSNLLTAEEGVFLGYMLTITVLFTYIMMFLAVLEVHMYSFKSAVISVVCTVFGMLVCVFLIFLLFNLMVELCGFFETVIKEISYRINYGF